VTVGVPQEPYRLGLLDQIMVLNARTQALAGLRPEQELALRPPDGGWSAGQVFEHLCVSHDSYLDTVEPLLAGAPRAAPPPSWRPTLGGTLLVRTFESRRRVPAPRIYRPAPMPRPRVVTEFLRRQGRLTRQLEEASTIPWVRVRTRSPITRLIRLNLGDCFTILVRHAARHMGQVERVLASLTHGQAP